MGGAVSDPEAGAWAAVGATRACAAAAHCQAVWAAFGRGWKTMSEAAATARDSMGAFGGAVGRNHVVNVHILAAATSGLDRGASALAAAEAEFRAAARLARLDAAERDMAAEAYTRAGDAKAARTQRGRAGKARKRGRTAAGWASNAAEKADILGQAKAMWDRSIAEWSEDEWGGDRARWIDNHSSLCADLDYDRAKWIGMAEAALMAEATAAEGLDRAADAADAATAAVDVDSDVPGAQEAAAALKEATEAAKRAVLGE